METITKPVMEKLTDAKRKEWREWGKGAYKGTASMMRNNEHHPDYDTPEKREAVHDKEERAEGGATYNFSETGRENLKTRFGYSDAAIDEAKAEWIEGYRASRKWYVREDAKQQAVLDEYAPIFRQAEKVAAQVDLSDIRDGFPCGWAIITLDYACRETELGKALAHFNHSDSIPYKYQIKLNTPKPGQCIAYDEKINAEVCKFLRSKGVLANSYSVID